MTMPRVPRQLTFAVIGVCIVAVALMSSIYGVWQEATLRHPQFDLIVEVDAPKRLGCFEAYLNGNYESPVRACLDRDGPSTLTLANVPGRISTGGLAAPDRPS